MCMPALTQSWTPAQVRELQREDRGWPRYELIDGDLLVTPAPGVPHHLAVVELLFLLRPYVMQFGLGDALPAPADIELDARSVLQPDLFVVPATVKFARWSDVSSLLLAVEVVSPSSARYDRVVKRQFFQRHEVPEYWVVDVESRLIERWRPADARPEIATDQLVWRPSRDAAALTIDLPALFDRVTR